MMLVYRISLAKWAKNLNGSGYPARWNPKGVFMLYTASTRALACLENLVHRSGEGLHKNFKTIVLKVPGSISMEQISSDELPQHWYTRAGYAYCQNIGRKWVEEQKSCALKVPSSIIPEENNFLFNPKHPEFSQIEVSRIENFTFDPRLAD
jgi:RES domain-containing protein